MTDFKIITLWLELDFWLYDGATNIIKSIMIGLEVIVMSNCSHIYRKSLMTKLIQNIVKNLTMSYYSTFLKKKNTD